MSSTVQIHVLGGLGEFGMNMMLFRVGDDSLLVDAGLMFPDEPWFGIDRRIPDPSVLDDCGTIHGLVLTHGHEDHIGAVPWLIRRHHLDLYGTPYTLALVRRRLREHPGLAPRSMRTLPNGGAAVAIGPFKVEPIRAAHSIPETRMLSIEVAGRRMLHTADFKLDTDLPQNFQTDIHRLQELGKLGIDVLLADSTNAEVPGRTASESTVRQGLADAIREAPGAVIVSTFSSHMQRIQAVGDVAKACGRRLALLGSSLTSQIEIAVQQGLIQFPAGLRIAVEELAGIPRNRILLVAAGSQGEPRSSLARIALGKHRWHSVQPGDLVLHSARTIPGNEVIVGRMLDRMRRLGAKVLTGRDAPIHVSGHPAAEELDQLIRWTRPRRLIPIHGDYRQLVALKQLGVAAGLEERSISILENGDRWSLDGDSVSIVRGEAPPTCLLDDHGDSLPYPILRERQWIAHSGVVFVAVRLVGRRYSLASGPSISSRGFSPTVGADGETLILGAKQVIVDALRSAPVSLRRDPESLEEALRQTLRRYFRQNTRRQPLIVVLAELDETH